MAHFVIQFKIDSRKKWHVIEKCRTKEAAEINMIEYRKHVRREDEHNGMAYRVQKMKGNLNEQGK